MRVVDGDTIVVALAAPQEAMTLRVRLLAVDTPETVHPTKPVEPYGPEASAYLHNLLDGECVFLKHDPKSKVMDRWGRYLAQVYRAPDGLWVNLELVRQGYGRTTPEYPSSYIELFQTYELRAKLAHKGLWRDVNAFPPPPTN